MQREKFSSAVPPTQGPDSRIQSINSTQPSPRGAVQSSIGKTATDVQGEHNGTVDLENRAGGELPKEIPASVPTVTASAQISAQLDGLKQEAISPASLSDDEEEQLEDDSDYSIYDKYARCLFCCTNISLLIILMHSPNRDFSRKAKGL